MIIIFTINITKLMWSCSAVIILTIFLITTLCPPKNVHPPFYFLNDSCQKLTNFNDFWLLNPEKIVHENLTDLSTSPVRCSYFTLGNPKNHFNSIHTSECLCYLRRKHLPTPSENVTTLTCELQNFFF